MRRENGKTIKMHQVIMGGPLKGLTIDHKDGLGLNNQKCNLRVVANRQNRQNAQNIKKTSQYPGVHWNKRMGRWYARIRINYIQKYLGCFTSELRAFIAYKLAVKKLGEEMIEELR